MKRLREGVVPCMEAEQCLLGLMILGGREGVREALSIFDNEFPKKSGPPVKMRLHRIIWAQLLEMLRRGDQIDVVTVYHAICGNPKSQKRNLEICDRVSPLNSWEYFVWLVEECGDYYEHFGVDSLSEVMGELDERYLESVEKSM